MTARKRIWITGIAAGLLAVLIVFLLAGVGSAPDTPVNALGYEDLIFRTDKIHRIEIYIDDWKGFLQTCADEKYASCTVVINKERFENVGLRAEDNSSLTTLAETGSSRYSWKLEFDHYDSDQTYHNLDKLNLNNLFQDNTMMKDYLSYRLMGELGTPAPLCSYTTVYVNGSSLGLYLAVEDIEESFLQRNFGSDYGQLYKPAADIGDNLNLQDVKLQYLGDEPERYPNIFNNARTQVTQEDQQRLIRSLKQLSTGKNLKNVLDIQSVIRYFTVHNFLCNEDSYTGATVRNYYLYEKDGQLSMLPWNYNLAFGGIPTGDGTAVVNSSILSPVSDGDLSGRPMLSWILESTKYTWLYKRYYVELMYVDMEALVEQTETMIAPYVQRDPSRFCSYEEFREGVQTLKQFLELRTQSVRQQLSGKPATVDAGDLDLSKMGGSTLPPRAKADE